MPLPNYDHIRDYYLSGKWNDIMLKTAVACHSITQDQYNALVAEKQGKKSTKK